MRWDALFADMELQLEAAVSQDRAQTVADLTRAERAGVLLADRLRGAVGVRLGITLRSGAQVDGVLTDVGPVWALLGDSGREHLVPLSAAVTLSGLGEVVAPPAGTTFRRLGLGHALRAVARDRSVVRVTTVAGAVDGRIDGVGADHMDVAVSYADSGRPTGERRVVPFTGLDLLSGL